MNPSRIIADDIDHDGVLDISFVAHSGYDRFAVFEETNTSSVNEPHFLPTQALISSVYPNPFNPTTNIQFDLPDNAMTLLEVYSINGELVTTLVNQNLAAGAYSATFDGSQKASGMYLNRLQAGQFTATSKMVLVK